ncbi:MAG: hypothetical protein ACRCZP_19865 [Phycicoccus sp.]
MTAPDPRAWRVAIALALALPWPPDWALWASGDTASECCSYCLITLGGVDDDDDPSFVCPRCDNPPVPVPAPWDVPAYLADCERRGVEPGPLPSLEWTGPDGLGWRVEPRDYPRVTFHRRGSVIAEWDGVDDSIGWHIDMPRDIAGRVYTLATAAAKAMVP